MSVERNGIAPALTNRPVVASVRGVQPARRIAAILLLALWLPALLHCRLEAAGLIFGSECCSETHSTAAAPEDTCADDSCGIAEGEFAPSSYSSLAAPAPVLCACLFCSHVIVPAMALAPPPVTGVDENEAAPPEIARSWVFVARAALSPRAPSLD